MRELIDWKLFGILLALGLLGTIAILPFALTLQAEVLAEVPLAMPVIILLSLMQSTVLLSIAIAVGLVASKRVGLELPTFNRLARSGLQTKDLIDISRFAVPLGVLVAVAIIVGDWIFISVGNLNFPEVASPIWQGALASLYGGIVEEILIRLFLMSVFVWVFCLFIKSVDRKPSTIAVWMAIFTSAVLFGIGHLPATALLVELTPLVIVRAIVLNGIGGVVFGWLYWQRGLATAMVAHFAADIVLLVVLPLTRLLF